MNTMRGILASCSALAAVLIIAGCGTSSTGGASGTPAAAAPAIPASSSSVSASPHLHIESPRFGAKTSAIVNVRLTVTHRMQNERDRVRFALDGQNFKPASLMFTLHGLRPGRHRLVVALVGDRSVRASTIFAVRRSPTAKPAPPPTRTPAITTQTAPVTPIAPPITTTTTATPPPPPPSSPTITASPPSSQGGGIPQGNGGDGDADNNGGPSDGDGNI